MDKGYLIFRQTDGNTFATTKKYAAKTLGGLIVSPGQDARKQLKKQFGRQMAKWYDKLVNKMGVGKNGQYGQYEVSDSLPPRPPRRIDVDL